MSEVAKRCEGGKYIVEDYRTDCIYEFKYEIDAAMLRTYLLRAEHAEHCPAEIGLEEDQLR